MFSLKKLQGDSFLRGSFIYFVGSMIVAGINYLFYPVLGHLLTPTQFGDTQVFISLISEIGIILGAFSIIIVNISLNIDDDQKRNSTITVLRNISFYAIITLATLLVIFIKPLTEFLNLGSVYPLVFLIIYLLLSISANVRSSFLQGRARFTELSINGIISSLGRLLFAVLLIYCGSGPLGAIASLILAQLASLLFLTLRTKKELTLGSHLLTQKSMSTLEAGSIKKELTFGALVLCATGLVTFIYTSDVLIVKHFFNSHDAGMYSGISAIAKIIFFLLAPIAGVLLSSVKIHNSAKENSDVLLKSLVISLCIGGTALLAFFLFYGIVISILLGSQYSPFAYLLPKVGVIMFLSSIVNLFVYYFLALRRYFLVGLSVVGIAILGVSLTYQHGTIGEVLNSLILSITSLIIIFIVFYAKNYFYRHTRI